MLWPNCLLGFRVEVSRFGHGRDKLIRYKIDAYRYLAWCLVLLEYGKDWIAKYQDYLTGYQGTGDPVFQ